MFVNYSKTIREILRSLPPSDDKKLKSEYASLLSNVVGCNRTLVIKEIQTLYNQVKDNYKQTPIDFFKTTGSLFDTLLKDMDSNSCNAFDYWAVYLINSERYGKGATKDMHNIKPGTYSDYPPECADTMLSFIKALSKKHKATIIDEILSISKEYGFFDSWISIDIDELYADGYDYKHFPISASKDYIDNLCIQFSTVRESLEAARKQVIDNHDYAESAGVVFVDYNLPVALQQEIDGSDNDPVDIEDGSTLDDIEDEDKV